MLKRLFLLIAALSLVFGAIAFLKYRQMQAMGAMLAQPRPPAAVASAEVREEQWRPRLRAVGSLVAEQGIAVSAEVTGLVKAIGFESGQRVEKGQVLVELDDAVDVAALKALQAERRLSEIQFKRSEDLLARKVISKSEYDEARARLDAASARVAQQRALIERKVLRAPFGGWLGIRAVNLGQYLEPGIPVTELQSFDTLYVDYTLPERYLGELAPGREVQLTVDAWPGQNFTGRITALAPAVERQSQALRVRATVANADGRLRPGMFAEVTTLAEAEQTVLTVPRTAVSFNTYGEFVFVIQQPEQGPATVQLRQVKSVESREGRVAISEGLSRGERVVRAGLVKLRNGMAVQIDNSVALDDAGISTE